MALPIKKALAAIKNPSKFKYIKYFDKLPIDEKTSLVESQHASEFNGNVFYIVKYLCSSEKYRDFKAAGTKGITGCSVRSVILPLLADHVLREANHYLRLLEEKEKRKQSCK